jgi:hypothetical protein
MKGDSDFVICARQTHPFPFIPLILLYLQCRQGCCVPRFAAVRSSLTESGLAISAREKSLSDFSIKFEGIFNIRNCKILLMISPIFIDFLPKDSYEEPRNMIR